MREDPTRSWFQGYVTWYLRGSIWFVQSAVAGAVSFLALGTGGPSGALGTLVAGLISALLLFRQVDAHIRQAVPARRTLDRE